MSEMPQVGTSLESWLDLEDIHGDVNAIAAKRDLVAQIEAARRRRKLTRPALARRAGVSASQLGRLLDPERGEVNVRVLARVALALGRGLSIGLC